MAKMITVKCDNCGVEVLRKSHQVYATSFCSISCLSEYRTSDIKRNCATCGKSLIVTQSKLRKSKSGRMYCSRSCAASYNNTLRIGDKHPNFGSGAGSYRKSALKAYGEKCGNEQCDLSLNGIKVPVALLDVHHIDGDRSNNNLRNLKVLCVWCHAKHTRGCN